MMNRQQDAVGKAAHHQVLTCLPPWMDNLSFAARWEGVAAATSPALPGPNSLMHLPPLLLLTILALGRTLAST